ncbi:MAG: NAD-binding protein, partial [Kiritimatiellae bacterium]|nr:NAD-binding protein [Kiritimatiellia bacterium]
MKTVVAGAGFTGIQLAKALVAEGGEVSLVESDPAKVAIARDSLDCDIAEAECNDPETLRAAGVAKADAFVALTGDDETNIVACSLAAATGSKALRIARVRNYSYYSLPADSGATVPAPVRFPGVDVMLNPDVEAAAALARAVEHGAVGNVTDLGGGHAMVALEVAHGSPLDGVALRDVPDRKHLLAWAETSAGPVLPRG